MMPGSLINKTAQEKQEHLSRDDFTQINYVYSPMSFRVCMHVYSALKKVCQRLGKKIFKNDFGLLLHEVQAGPFAKIQIEYMIMCVCGLVAHKLL